MPDPGVRPDTSAGCLLRTYWMLVGNFLIAFLAVLLAEQKGDFYTFKDILYWLAVGSVIAARYMDIQLMRGHTADGTPATMKNWERHSTVLGTVAVLVWIGCHLYLSTRG